MKIIAIGCMVLITIAIGISVDASPSFDVSTSSKTAEKGHTFQILVTIKSTEPLHDIQVAVTEPEGFYAQAIGSPGIAVVDEAGTKLHSIARVAELGRNSRITVTYKVWTPKLLGGSKAGDKKSLYSTRDPKKFPVNIFYQSQADTGAVNGSYSTIVTIRYTTSIGHYLIAGLFGVLLGFMVKIATQYKEEIN